MTHSPDHGRPSDGSGLSIVVPEARRLPGTLPHLIAYAAALGEPAEASQCGFKAFRRQILHEIFSRQRLEGFRFDAEVFWRARRPGFRVAPRWRDAHCTSVRPIRDSGGMLLDLGRRPARRVDGALPAGPTPVADAA
jgi:hypothetical protein